jgi:hypothetical protein
MSFLSRTGQIFWRFSHLNGVAGHGQQAAAFCELSNQCRVDGIYMWSP